MKFIQFNAREVIIERDDGTVLKFPTTEFREFLRRSNNQVSLLDELRKDKKILDCPLHIGGAADGERRKVPHMESHQCALPFKYPNIKNGEKPEGIAHIKIEYVNYDPQSICTKDKRFIFFVLRGIDDNQAISMLLDGYRKQHSGD